MSFALLLGLCACTPATVKVWPSSGPTASNDGTVVVQAGDSLYGIAARNGVSVVDLALANGITEPFLIHPGDRLRLPSGAAAKTLAPPKAPAAPTVRTEPLPDTSDAPKPTASKPAASASASNPASAKPNASAATTSKVAAAASVAKKAIDPARTSWRWPADGAVVNVPARSDAKAYALDIAGAAGSPVRATAAGKVLYSGEGSPGYEQLVVIEHAGGWVSSYSHNRKRLVGEGQNVAAGAVIAEMGRTGVQRDMLHFELRRAGQLVDPRTVLPPR
ncbi:M23 family metallopeptidase [Lysobacter arvi]|uniref:M23 family metallopeptidase n=1 Tax=Lysobacter arvi TaxID=3038776 RepID=A0ABU1CGK8_9GAMM|nr:M23 family metallopeptidase [Lysobacter arvi]MDR0184091.1 M23 family metallopeptidase [Lysobacter arvi]